MSRGVLVLALALVSGLGLGCRAGRAATGDPGPSEAPAQRPTSAEPVLFVEAPTDPNATRARGATGTTGTSEEPGPPPGPGPEVSEADLLEAKRLFSEGLTRFEQGDYAVALTLFEQAHARVAKPELMFNVARCLERLGRIEDACDAYLELRDQPGPGLREAAAEAMAQLGC